MKILNLLALFILLSFLVVGYTSELSEEEAINNAVDFALTYVDEKNLDIPNEIEAVYAERIDKMWNKRWVVYFKQNIYADEDKVIPHLLWVSISDNKQIKGYNFVHWGGGSKQD
jgi:hypothetical protein